MGVEFELKYAADERQQQAIMAAFAPMEQTIAMETTYYDTPSRQLAQRHVTLRRRLENGISICTVKTPAGDAGRGEWECACDDINEGILMLCKLGGPKELLVLTAEGLVPICGARFTRQTKILEEAQFSAELALDKGVLTGGDQEIPLCEVELELKSGSREALIAYAAEFAKRFALHHEPKSKFRRALNLAEGEKNV